MDFLSRHGRLGPLGMLLLWLVILPCVTLSLVGFAYIFWIVFA